MLDQGAEPQIGTGFEVEAPAMQDAGGQAVTSILGVELGQSSDGSGGTDAVTQDEYDAALAKLEADEPLTQAEKLLLKNGVLRQSDYTRKTQAVSEKERQVQEAISLHQRLYGSSPEEAQEALMQLANERGIQFGNDRPRNSNGTFAPKQETPNPDLYDLNDFTPGTYEYDQAVKTNAAIQRAQAADARAATLEAKFDQLVGGLSDAVAQNEARMTLDAMAKTWQASGFTRPVNTDKAMGMIGKPITAEDAMWLAHREDALRFAHEQGAKGDGPRSVLGDEPMPARSGAKYDATGKSIAQIMKERYGYE